MSTMPAKPCPVSVAPMMDWTDRHCRYFLRRINPRVRLYTEMIATASLLHGDRDRMLAYHASEHPLALQLGGSQPQDLARCARWAQDWGYDEVNLNVGCPSERVKAGQFGACLMRVPEQVADCVRAMRDATALPVTVKCRTGVDERDSYADLVDFVATLADAGLTRIIVHARKAWLKGLSPKQNRDVPPLHYERVYRLKSDFPQLQVDINGGIGELAAIRGHLHHVDGVMLGRAAYHNPWLLAGLSRTLDDGGAMASSRHAVVEAMLPYVEQQLGLGVRLQQITRHMLGLFQGQPGARLWRRTISERAHLDGAGTELLQRALQSVPRGD